MIRIFILIIGIVCLNPYFCLSQNNEQYQDKYIIILDIQKQSHSTEQSRNKAIKLTQTTNSLIPMFDPEKVIYVKNAGKLLSLSLKGILVDTIPAQDLDSNLNVVSSNIFTKFEGDAFSSSELISFLEAKNAKDIILVGRLAEECLYKTALGGKNREFCISVIPEAIVGKTEKKKEKALIKMSKKGIKLLPINNVISTQ